MITKSFVTARYAETDQMGVIHHSVYAVWYELARTDLCLSLLANTTRPLYMKMKLQ